MYQYSLYLLIYLRITNPLVVESATLANNYVVVRFQVLTAASMMFRIVIWDVLPCKMIIDRRFRGAYSLMMEAVRTSETSVDMFGNECVNF
jgi:hypothetical protein